MFTIVARDPVEFERVKARERERCMVAEIIRLKLKCGEELTDAEVIGNEWGGAPMIFKHVRK